MRTDLDHLPDRKRRDLERIVQILFAEFEDATALVAYKVVDMVIGLRVPEEEEREGLDITSHGESAYNA